MTRLTAEQEAEARRLVEEEGLTEEQARRLAREFGWRYDAVVTAERAATTYYSFRRDDGEFAGFVRLEEPGPVLSYADRERGEWVERPELLRHLVEPELERVDEEQARQLAERYGVDLDAEPVRSENDHVAETAPLVAAEDADFRVRDDGTTFHVRATSDAGSAWLASRYRDDELTAEGGVAAEPRSVDEVIDEIERAGLRCGPPEGPPMLDQYPGEAED
jgi:hypothetical protein